MTETIEQNGVKYVRICTGKGSSATLLITSMDGQHEDYLTLDNDMIESVIKTLIEHQKKVYSHDRLRC